MTKQKSYTLSYEFNIRRYQQTLNTPWYKIRAISHADRERFSDYLGQQDRNITITPKVYAIADELCSTETHPVRQAKKIYDWIIGHGEYWKKDRSQYQPSGRGSTEYFLTECTGNCTDFHAMFISLMRARGIPSRINFGSVFQTDKQGTGEDLSYHCWPEFYAPGHGWVAVDASQADFETDKQEFYFGNLETRRIVFARGRDINLAPLQSSTEPLIYLLKAYAEVDGKSVEFDRVLSYELAK